MVDTASRQSAGKPGFKVLLLAGIALAGALALLTATQSWVDIALTPGAAVASELRVTGHQMNPSLSPVALAALALALVLAIAGPIFRRVLGMLALLLGVAIESIGILALVEPAAEASSAVTKATGIAGVDAQRALIERLTVSFWPTLTLVAGVLLFVCGVLVLLLSGRWKRGGRKYEHGAQPARSTPVATGRGKTSIEVDRDRIADWDALSDGDDPSGDDESDFDLTGDDASRDELAEAQPSDDLPASDKSGEEFPHDGGPGAVSPEPHTNQ